MIPPIWPSGKDKTLETWKVHWPSGAWGEGGEGGKEGRAAGAQGTFVETVVYDTFVKIYTLHTTKSDPRVNYGLSVNNGVSVLAHQL